MSFSAVSMGSIPFLSVVAANTAADARLNRDAIILSIVIILLLMAVIVILVWRLSRKRATFLDRQRSLYRAGKQTLTAGDALACEITSGPRKLSKRARSDLDQADALRRGADHLLDRAGTDVELVRANEDAAEAVILLRQIHRTLGADMPDPPARCYYCGREDGTFQESRIGTEAGPRLTARICPGCALALTEARYPCLAVAPYHGMHVPWWAVPNNLWYVPYGGEAWQYWLPIATGQTLEEWLVAGSIQGMPAVSTASL